MKSVLLSSSIFILTLITFYIPTSTSIPFIVIHGIGQDCSDKQVSELTKHLSHWSATEGYCIGSSHGKLLKKELIFSIESSHGRLSSWLLPLMDQAAITCTKVKQMKELSQGYNIVGLSQGTLIARSLIEFCDGAPKAKNFISLGGPHAGIGTAPFCLFSMVYSAATKMLNFVIYRKFIQKNLAASGYFKIPNNIPLYLRKSKFLPKLNNELPNKRNSIYKERFKSLENLVLIKFEDEKILKPKETSWFGYYQEGSSHSVLPVRKTKLYVEDWIGLKALDEAGRVKYVTFLGGHLAMSDDDLKKHIVPYLKDKETTWLNTITPRLLLPNRKTMLLTMNRQCPKDVQVIRR